VFLLSQTDKKLSTHLNLKYQSLDLESLAAHNRLGT